MYSKPSSLTLLIVIGGGFFVLRGGMFAMPEIKVAAVQEVVITDNSMTHNVELMLRLNGKLDRQGRQRARNLLVRLGSGDHLKSRPSRLSEGQQQQAAIARALIHDPEIVLADEPTAVWIGNVPIRSCRLLRT